MFLNISGEPIPAAIIPALKMIPVRPMATKAVAKNRAAGSKLDFHRGAILPDRRLIVAARFQAADDPQCGVRHLSRHWCQVMRHSPLTLLIALPKLTTRFQD